MGSLRFQFTPTATPRDNGGLYIEIDGDIAMMIIIMPWCGHPTKGNDKTKLSVSRPSICTSDIVRGHHIHDFVRTHEPPLDVSLLRARGPTSNTPGPCLSAKCPAIASFSIHNGWPGCRCRPFPSFPNMCSDTLFAGDDVMTSPLSIVATAAATGAAVVTPPLFRPVLGTFKCCLLRAVC